MNEEIEYAEMLEIPVSTVNVVHKKPTRKRKTADTSANPLQPNAKAALQSAQATQGTQSTQTTPTATAAQSLKDSVIAQVNDKLSTTEQPNANTSTAQEITAEAALFAESANSEGRVDFSEIPERIDTVRLYSAQEHALKKRDLYLTAEDYALQGETDADTENEPTMYGMKQLSRAEKRTRIVLTAEFAAACALCGAIFLTNVFMPNSAINTFFRAMGQEKETVETDARTYADFTLSPIVSELSDAEMTVSPAGILTFTDECCVYPAADGTVTEVKQNADGTYTVKISHSDSFSGVINGLNVVYYEAGENVKSNLPLGFTDGETEVQLTMYSGGELLNCYQLTEENCLAWTVTE